MEQQGRIVQGRFIDDYDLINEDFDLFLEIGRQEIEWQKGQDNGTA